MAAPRTTPALAAVASLFIPGLGQLYAGRVLRGLLCLLAFWLLASSIPNAYVRGALTLALRAGVAWDAWRLAVARAAEEAAEPDEQSPLLWRLGWSLARLPWAVAAPAALSWVCLQAASDALLRGKGGAVSASAFGVFFGALAAWALLRIVRVVTGRENLSLDAIRHSFGVSFAAYALLALVTLLMLPKVIDIVRYSSEGAAKGNLGDLRSRVESHKAAHDGAPPADLEEIYPGVLPRLWPRLSAASHPPTIGSLVLSSTAPTDSGKWAFVVGASTPALDGAVFIDCTHTDARGSVWAGY